MKKNEIEQSDDCVSRADLLKKYEDRLIELQKAHRKDTQYGVNWCINTLKELPPVTPTHGTCKDCNNREDCLIDIDNDFYCADFEKRCSEND